MSELRFVEATHQYFLGEVEIPSTSKILEVVKDFAGVPADILEWSALRGKYVHLACEMNDRGELDYDGTPEYLKGYINAWRAFKKEYKPEFTEIETMRHSAIRNMAWAGTLDRITTDGTIIDIKTSAKHSAMYDIQMCGYAMMFQTMPPAILVYLKKDGKFKVKTADMSEDYQSIFLSALKIYYFKKENPYG
jgi:hypothetical protein